jgi:hypothetical protein
MKEFKVVLGSKRIVRSDTPGVPNYHPWTATVYVETNARKDAAGAAFRKLGLLSSETRVLRVEAA